MSEAKEPKGTPAKWTEGEKLNILFRILYASVDNIQWDKVDLPEGRTKKAIQIMVDKEKAKIREAIEAKGSRKGGEEGADADENPATPAPSKGKGKKRSSKAAADADGEEGSAKKKPRTPRKKKAPTPKVKAGEDESEGEKPPVKDKATEGAEQETSGDSGDGEKSPIKAEAEDEAAEE